MAAQLPHAITSTDEWLAVVVDRLDTILGVLQGPAEPQDAGAVVELREPATAGDGAGPDEPMRPARPARKRTTTPKAAGDTDAS